ncbi:MAG: hypothetical protein FJ109_19580 [Deltaproteobacteria bacterium]|nr:hypothetical protein [Deltaproteobacteria bacterium]
MERRMISSICTRAPPVGCDGSCDLPLRHLVCGSGKGPTFLVATMVHGDEPTGCAATWYLQDV